MPFCPSCRAEYKAGTASCADCGDALVDEGSPEGSASFDGADPVGQPDAEGGRGLGLIKRLSDEAYFERLPEGGLEVKIVKYLP